MKNLYLILLIVIATLSTRAFAASDELPGAEFSYSSADPEKTLLDTVAKPRDIFKRYRPAVDSSTEILKPLKVSGSQSNPRLEMTAKKCVLFTCQTVDLDASVTIREVSGSCQRNYLVNADLGRSGAILSDNYKALQVSVCFRMSRQNARIIATASAIRAPSYGGGIVASEILKLLNLQVAPMTKAIRDTLEANGARKLSAAAY